MFIKIDRFVLSQFEKSTQFLQKHFGVKITTITSLSANIIVLCIFMGWYFTGIPAAYPLFIDCALVIAMFWHIFFDSKNHQAEAETRAMQRVSNPLKIIAIAIFLRVFYNSFIVLISVKSIFDQESMDATRLIFRIYTLSMWIFTYAICVDILPPSSSKEDNWIKNLFRKRSLST